MTVMPGEPTTELPSGSSDPGTGDSATDVSYSGSADFYGSIVANDLALSGTGDIHADESLADSPMSGGPKAAELVQ